MRATVLGALVALASGWAVAQGPPSPNEAFEVVAIRPFASNDNGSFPVGVKGGPGTDDPTRMIFTNYSIQNLLVLAYTAKYYQVVAPAWTNSKEARFNIETRLRPGATKQQANEMIKSLLADRFKLVLRRETKEMPVHIITVAKDGPKLKPAADGPAGGATIPSIIMVRTGSQRINSKNRTIEDLADTLSTPTFGPVLDKTGLTGKYDFTLEYGLDAQDLNSLRQRGMPAPAADAPPDFPELPRAMLEQLGLRIDAAKAPVEYFTIESVSRTPTDN